MSQNEYQRLINIYHNTPTIEALVLTLSHDLQSHFILIAWHILDNMWYIPIIYDKEIDNNVVRPNHIYVYISSGIPTVFNISNNVTGWYMDEKPTCNNIPIRHTTLKTPQYIDYDTFLIIYDSSIKMSSIYLFICESYLKTLIYQDQKYRNCFQQELLLNNICHSIRTPLNRVLHMTNTLMDKENEITIKEPLCCLNKSTIQLANCIFDIIDLAQLNLGKMYITNTTFNIRDCIRQVIELIQTKDIKIEYFIEPIVPKFIYSDIKRIKQILINLFRNYIKNLTCNHIILYVNAELIYLDQEDVEISYFNNSISVNNNQYNLIFTFQSLKDIDLSKYLILLKLANVLCDMTYYDIELHTSYLLARQLNGNIHIQQISNQCILNQNTLNQCIPFDTNLENKKNMQPVIFKFNLPVYEDEPPKVNCQSLQYLTNKNVLFIISSDKTSDLQKTQTDILMNIMKTYNMNYYVASTYDEVLILYHKKTFDMIIYDNQLDNVTIKKLKDHWVKAIFLYLSTDLNDSRIYDQMILLPVDEYNFKYKLLFIFNPFLSTKILIIDISKLDSESDAESDAESEYSDSLIIKNILYNKGYHQITIININNLEKYMPNLSESTDVESEYIKQLCQHNIWIIDTFTPEIFNNTLFKHFIQNYQLLHKESMPFIIGITTHAYIEEKDQSYTIMYKPIDADELDHKIKSFLFTLDQ